MCGIVGYIGEGNATPIILNGLRRLEYRGYDSSGICVVSDDGAAEIVRSEGKLVNLERLLEERGLNGSPGIGHTRWATHGRPSEINAHPHKAGGIILVHNGIIENHPQLKADLRALGHTFKSETDTEVIAHLIEERMKGDVSFEKAVRLALGELKGAYALCILCESEPDVMIAAKQGSPLVVGLGDDQYFVASDIPALIQHTRDIVFLEDGEVAVFRDGQADFTTLAGCPMEKTPRRIDWSPVLAEKGGYRHFML
ncbi:MAG TPA: glutamine--fructose-6-phosphate aminotransferase, partial [Geobacteraceae bacterium]|nr:glutamine--fructose-6-phosphate aminotransferase [Geobacteraceae bacterium]